MRTERRTKDEPTAIEQAAAQVTPRASTVLGTANELLPVKLTDDQVRDRGRELAQRVEGRTSEIADQKTQRDRMKKDIEDLDGDIARLSRVVRSGEEDQFVAVESRLEGEMVVSVRTDTGEQLRSRQATESERQISLFVNSGDAPAATAQ